MDRLNHLVFVQYNSKLRNKKERIKEKKNIDPLLASEANDAQGWLIDGGDDEQDVEPNTGLTWKVIEEACGANEVMQLRRSSRVRQLHEDDFKSDTEEEEVGVNEEDIEFESDHEEVVSTKNYEEEDD